MKEHNQTNSKSKKLSTQLSVIMALMLTVIFVVFIFAAVIMSSSALKSAISSDFSNNSEKNAAKVQSSIDAASALGQDLQFYMNSMFAIYNEQLASDTVDKTLVRSDVCGKDILSINKEIEDYAANTIMAAVSNNPDIMAAGLFFEPYAFDPSLEEYAIYIQVSNLGEYLPVPYSEYSVADYYTVAMETQKPYFTEPYDFEGAKMISGCYPIISEGKSQGVVSIDINASNFNQFAVDTAKYPTIFNEILTDKSTVVFDSTDLSGSYVGMSTSDWIKNATDLERITQGYAAKQPFSLETVGDKGQKLSRFYYPLTAGEQTWWSLTALDSNDMNKSTTELATLLIIIAVGSLIAIIIVTATILHRKISPINQVVTAATKIVQGELDVTLEVKSNDEIGMLARSFIEMSTSLREIISDVGYVLDELSQGNFLVSTRCEERYIGDYSNILTASQRISDKLSDTLSQINEASVQVSAGSDQVSSGAQALSQGATEQASSVEELAATINEISTQVKETADNAHNANQVVNETGAEIQNCDRQMQELNAAMNDISQKSSEIGKIIKTIEDIAFQTNILALNAAVEAARAGAAGKGFAVVADEVRNLASKSAEAAKNTTALIGESILSVENGTKLTVATAESLNLVVERSKQIESAVQRISEATDEQASSLNQVTTGVDQISSVVQTNSATAEESAAASEELNGQAQMLKTLVGQFKLKGNTTKPSTHEYYQPRSGSVTFSESEKY